MEHAPAVAPRAPTVIQGTYSALEVRQQVNLIQEVLNGVMVAGVHYGYIPGTEPKNEEEKKTKKPALLKGGAEKLCLTFRLGPDYEIVEKEADGDHLSITSKCILTHIPTGLRWGSALASCSTKESKYAYRHGSRVCPACGAEAIIKGKAEFGGGWLCFGRKGGCGEKFLDDDPSITDQTTGKVANDDKADQYNTVLKMSNKRALIAAVLNATAASDIFHQDIVDEEDLDQPNSTEKAGTGGAQSQATTPKRAVATPTRKSEKKPSVDPDQKVNDGQVKLLQSKLEHATGGAQAFCENFKIESVPLLPFGKLNEALTWISAQTPG